MSLDLAFPLCHATGWAYNEDEATVWEKLLTQLDGRH